MMVYGLPVNFQAELQRQLDLAKSVRAGLRKSLENAQDDIRQSSTRLGAPVKQQPAVELDVDYVTFNDIREYFIQRQAANPSKHSIETVYNYFGKNQNTGSFNTVLELIDCKTRDYVIPCFLQMKKWIELIRNAYSGNAGTLLSKF